MCVSPVPELRSTSGPAPKPGRSPGSSAAIPTAITATRDAPRNGIERARPLRPSHCQIGPQSRSRRTLSARNVARTPRRNRTAKNGRPPSSRTVSANPTSAIGGSIARIGLPARTSSACAENAAAHIAVTAARNSGGSVGVGETCTRACCRTSPIARPTAANVRPVGSPQNVVCGNTSSATARRKNAALASVATRRFRRSNAEATAAEATPAATRRRVAAPPVKTRPNPSARGAQEERERREGQERLSAGRRCRFCCHTSLNRPFGGSTRTCHPARESDRRATEARPSSVAARSAGSVEGSVG